MANPEPHISTEPLRGATIRTAYVEREVRAYAIFENEVRTISMWNTFAGVFFSLGAASLSFAVGIWTNWSFAVSMPPEGSILSRFVAPALCLVTLVFWGLALWAVYSRRQTWNAVRTESKQPTSADDTLPLPTFQGRSTRRSSPRAA
jgi:hypothetical protein